MADASTAADQLERLLHILPAAAGEDGASPEALARALGVDAATVLRDLEEVTTRSYYHPAGGAEDLQVTLEPARVRVWTGGAFQRPVKLSPLEVVCLALGLRGRALAGAESEGASASLADLLARVEAHLAVPSDEALGERFHAPDVAADPDGVRAAFHDGIEGRRVVCFRYLKPESDAPEARTVQPWALLYAEGEWYVLGHDEDAGEARAFRLDRVLEVALDARRFEPPEALEPATYLEGEKLFFTHGHPVEAVVRYSPRIARWIAEREDGERQDDGALLVRHHVADPAWLVRHVLQYGADAEVLEPEALRELVQGTAEGMAG